MAAAVTTNINYFDLSNERVFYPGTAGYQRRKFDTKPMTINDVRGHEDSFTLDKNGFQFLKGDWSEEDVEDTPEHIQNVVFPETIAAVKKAYVTIISISRMELTLLGDQIRSNRCPALLTPHPSTLGRRCQEDG